MTQSYRRIGEMLVAREVVTEPQISEALERMRVKGGKLVENLIALGHLNPHDFLCFLTRQGGAASIDLKNYMIPAEIIRLLPAEFALKHEVLPIDKTGSRLTVGIACPLNASTTAEIEAMTQLRVRGVLVSLGDLRAALTRYYDERREPAFHGVSLGSRVYPAAKFEPEKNEPALPRIESGLAFGAVASLVRNVTSLPALPESVASVRQAMADTNTPVIEVSGIIGRDPALAAKVLGLANSAAFGFTRRVDNVELAVSLLGLREIYKIVLAAAVVDYFSKSSSFDYKQFWKRSMLCAATCRIIASIRSPGSERSLSFAGLLHDLGKAVLAEVAPMRYCQISQAGPEQTILEAEREMFGVAHPEIGYILTETWGLPAEIITPIRFHADVCGANEYQESVAIVSLAAAVIDAILMRESGFEEETLQEAQTIAGYMDLDSATLDGIYEQAWDAARDTQEL